MKIALNKNEYAYLCQASFLPSRLRDALSFIEKSKDTYSLTISEDQANEIRDLCGEQVQIAGFDEKYEPTQEGGILEDLIDRFFPG